MADKEKLIEAVGSFKFPIESCVCTIGEYIVPYNIQEPFADHLIANGVTVQDSKVVEIDQFKLPIDDAILILKEEHKQRVDGYTTHLSYGGKGDPAEEAHLDALEMAIAALEWQKRQMH